MALKFEPVKDLLPRGADYGLDKQSLERCHFERHSVGRDKRYIPRFAYNTAQLQRTIALRAWRFAHNDAPFPAVYNRTTLDADCAAKVEMIAARNPASRYTQRLQDAVTRCGTYMGFLAILSWQAWRSQPLRYCNEIAEEFGMTHAAVISQLAKLVRAAEALGYPTYETASPNKGRKKPRKPLDAARVLQLWHAGKSAPQIAAEIGETRGHRIVRVLKENGIVINRSEAARRRWQDDGYQKRHAVGMSAAWDNPLTRPRLLAQVRAAGAYPRKRKGVQS